MDMFKRVPPSPLNIGLQALPLWRVTDTQGVALRNLRHLWQFPGLFLSDQLIQKLPEVVQKKWSWLLS
ncbi:MAG TPA: hypothetical protein EYQ43_09435 [Methyloprofundus sp.]|nr:hypothetical protein [Methyloprofundus sp.]